MKVLCILVGIMGAAFYGAKLHAIIVDPSSVGIITLEGWEHGMALCGEGDDIEVSLIDDPWLSDPAGYHWTKDNVYYLVNYGHMGDIQVRMLVATASLKCSELDK